MRGMLEHWAYAQVTRRKSSARKGTCMREDKFTSPAARPPGYGMQVTLGARGSTFLPYAAHGKKPPAALFVGLEVSFLLTSLGRRRRPP